MKSIHEVPEVIDCPEKYKKLGEGVTNEWFIYYHDPETPWIKEKILLHAVSKEEVFESFVYKFPGMVATKIDYYGIWF